MATAAACGLAARRAVRAKRRIAALETLLPQAPAWATYKQIVKPTPDELFAPRGNGCDFETRLSALGDGFVTPTDRFYVRQHSPTPRIDPGSWRLLVDGSGVHRQLEVGYAELRDMPQVTYPRTLECAGNGRRFFKETYGIEAEGGQWGTGALGTAEWTGVRLRDLLDRAGLADDARDVMPEGLDDHRVRRPLPLAKALADDTLVALEMNGEPLWPDHGFPARLVVSGWVGVAWIKWLGRIQVATQPLHSPYNTTEYVLIGPHYPTEDPALGPVVTEMPVMSVIELDRPAVLPAGPHTIRGRALAGEGRPREVAVRIDDGPWQDAELTGPNVDAAWVRWEFTWDATPGAHEISVRATDDQGRRQPDSVPWNHHGYLYNAVTSHPVTVLER
ncbi:MAG: sulfite oxidase [Actinomycetota bacterium]|nr:sulfite oxidase [Actinomycetota bacterium]